MSAQEITKPADTLLEKVAKHPLPKWQEQHRSAALESFTQQGLPNSKNESYKYTRLDKALKNGYSINASSDTKTAPSSFAGDYINIVLLNGELIELPPAESTPKGLTINNITAVEDETLSTHYGSCSSVKSDPFIALNTALTKGGVYIHIQKNSVIEQAIHITHISSNTDNSIINPRNLIIVEEGVQATFIESFETQESSANTFNNAMSEFVIGKGAVIHHHKIQDEENWGIMVNTTNVSQAEKSVFTTNNITLSGSLVRNNLNIDLNGEHIESNLNGLCLVGGKEVVDNQTLVNHNKPNCNSNELYKGVINGKATVTFNGKIHVKKDAQKTNAFQSNKNILLSDDGTINTKPQLEIYADDVKCSHGTTTGKLDDEHIFYLRSRGLSEESAKKLLLFAFSAETLETINNDLLKEQLEKRILDKLAPSLSKTSA